MGFSPILNIIVNSRLKLDMNDKIGRVTTKIIDKIKCLMHSREKCTKDDLIQRRWEMRKVKPQKSKKKEREKARSSHVLIKIIGKNGLNLLA